MKTLFLIVFSLLTVLIPSQKGWGQDVCEESVITALHENGDHFSFLPGFQGFVSMVNPDGSIDVTSDPFPSGVTTPLFCVPGAEECGRVDYTDIVLHISPDKSLLTLDSTILVCKCATPGNGCGTTCGTLPGDSTITVRHALYQANSLAGIANPDPSHPEAVPFIWVMTKHDTPTEVTGEFVGKSAGQLDYRCFSDVDFNDPLPFVFQHGSTYIISTPE